MRRLAERAFRSSLRLYPPAFRRAYGDEMTLVFSERIQNVRFDRLLVSTAAEVCDSMESALRLRLEGIRVAPRIAVSAMTAAAIATLVSLQSGPLTHAHVPSVADSVFFRASDPAGNFSLLMRNGRPVMATLDRESVPSSRVVQRGDSIRFLAPDGEVVLALAYDRNAGRIAWDARPKSCRGRASACYLAQ